MRILAMGAAVAAAVAAAHAARAEYTLIEGDSGQLRAGVNAAAAYLNEPNTCYGESPERSFCDFEFPDDPQERDIQWVDGFVQARLAGDYDVGAAGRLFGEASVVASATRGAGDTFRITANGEELFPELYYAGWASGDMFPGLGTDALKVSYGNQRFTIGDGFIVYDGVGDWNRKSAFYTAPRRAFRKAGVVRLDTGPVRAAAFMLGGSVADREGIRLAGVDLEYVDEARGTLGLSYIRVRDDSPKETLRGMITVSVRAQGRPLSAPGWSSLFLSGEYVDQSGAADIGENAWYVEAGYGFDDAPWKPYVGYRFNRFSKNYNKLYPGFSRGWGTWFYGEVLTNYFWHRNLQIHMLQARAAPADNLAITANFYDIDFVDVAPDIGDRNATQEFNLIADWTITPNMGLSPIFGVSFPGEGITRRTDFGDETAYLFGLYAWASF